MRIRVVVGRTAVAGPGGGGGHAAPPGWWHGPLELAGTGVNAGGEGAGWLGREGALGRLERGLDDAVRHTIIFTI